jgi:hypothetical protein
MKVTIFYSWQSDLPNNTNRGFIESVINKAINSINHHENFELDICLERDTQGTPGSPDIAKTILDKILNCDIFVADISIVTGDVASLQRPSPNPNVLIELGYAISFLGWERIILFCNEIYGTDEKLPFDIRQHRRIGYKLNIDDPKEPVRDQLAKTLKDGLIRIVEHLHETMRAKGPELSVNWTYFKLARSDKKGIPYEKKSISPETLILQRAVPIDIDDLKSVVHKDIEVIRQIDGSMDPKWNEKVNSFVDKCDAFLKQLDSEKAKRNYLINENIRQTVKTTLTLYNKGSSPASEVQVKVKLPDWLLVFKKCPDKDDIPKRPDRPVPTPPKPLYHDFNLGKIFPQPSYLNIPSFQNLNFKETSACFVKNETLGMWADKLLHKHELTIEDDCFYFLALPQAEIGEHKFTGQIFCAEYDDWKDIELLIKVIDISRVEES